MFEMLIYEEAFTYLEERKSGQISKRKRFSVFRYETFVFRFLIFLPLTNQSNDLPLLLLYRSKLKLRCISMIVYFVIAILKFFEDELIFSASLRKH